jgi:flagellar basal body-associated protein FliL
MTNQKYRIFIFSGLAIILVAVVLLLYPTADAQAQCGSQASSCKNCHEVQGQDPVNSDGTAWHPSHAFGDFCYLCHAGNNQSMDKDIAHTGMVPPLSDIKAGCQSCHPDDLQARAQVYASLLGVTVGSGGASTTGDAAAPAEQSPTQAPEEGVEATAPEMVSASNEVIDYNQRYDELVLGKKPVNWGNIILIVMIVMLLIGGGAFVYINERKLRGQPLGQVRPTAEKASKLEAPVVEGYSVEVTALLPKIAKLNPAGLHALQRLLENPDNANELFHSLSKLDPELVKRVRNLDRSSRELLLAMSGE